MYCHLGKAVLRTPLFPLTDLTTVVTTADFNVFINNKLRDPVFMEALYWASPDFYKQAIAIKEEKEIDQKKKERILHTLKKYVIRSSARCTPYGLFAASSVQAISGGGNFTLSAVESNRKVRSDVGLLQQIVKKLEENEQIWPFLRYQLNPSLYIMPDSYRYIESIVEEHKSRYQLSTMERTELLDEIVYQAKIEALSLGQISDLIGYEENEVDKRSFVKELLIAQFLVSDLPLVIGGDEMLDRLLIQLRTIEHKSEAIAPYIALLLRLKDGIELIEGAALGDLPLDFLDTLHLQINQLGIKDQTVLFQVDSCYCASEQVAGLSESDVKQLWKGAEVLSRFTPQKSSAEIELQRFRKLFLEKYEAEEVPLLEALDVELGIGFPAFASIGNVAHHTLTDKPLGISANQRAFESENQDWHAFLDRQYEEVCLRGEKEIVIQEEDIKAFKPKVDQLADTVSVMCSRLPDGRLHLQHVGGATANALLGRFAHLHQDFYEIGKELADCEKKLKPHAILAEIIFLPKGRVGNVLRRPEHYGYVIYCSANASCLKQNRVGLDDLLISVRGDNIVLRSKKLNKQVITKLSSAHNYAASELPVYQFLCAIQHQQKPGLHFSWGARAERKRFLPQVRYGNIILQRARWYFDREDYQKISRSKDPIIALKELLHLWNVSEYVLLGEGDNELLIHTQRDDFLHLLWVEWQRKGTIRLIEELFLKAKTTREVFWANQFIIPFYRTDTTQEGVFFNLEHTPVQRIFLPGSEWVFIKIYCGAFVSDEILVELIKVVGDNLMKRGCIDHYFFVRYTDPHYHIRFRMHVIDPIFSNYTEVIHHFHTCCEPFVTAKLIWKVQFDTYKRELERYGVNQIQQAEQLFAIDTQVLLQLLMEEPVRDDNSLRLHLGVTNLDSWLDLFNLQLTDKLAFTEQMMKSFTEEFGRKVKTELETNYRNVQLQRSAANISDFSKVFMLRKRAVINDKTFDNLASYIHMSMNRWFKTDQRLMEFACYLYAFKQYKKLQHPK